MEGVGEEGLIASRQHGHAQYSRQGRQHQHGYIAGTQRTEHAWFGDNARVVALLVGNRS